MVALWHLLCMVWVMAFSAKLLDRLTQPAPTSSVETFAEAAARRLRTGIPLQIFNELRAYFQVHTPAFC